MIDGWSANLNVRRTSLKTLGNILWYFPFFGFVDAIIAYLLGLLMTVTVVAAPIGLGLMELGKFLFAPFSYSMISKSELEIKPNKAWETYSIIIRILYLPFGIVLSLLVVIQIALEFLSIVGIPIAFVLAKSIGSILNPVNKKCVHFAVADELQKRKAQKEVDKHLGT